MEKKISDGGRELSEWQKMDHLDIYGDQVETLSVSSTHTTSPRAFPSGRGKPFGRKGRDGQCGISPVRGKDIRYESVSWQQHDCSS